MRAKLIPKFDCDTCGKEVNTRKGLSKNLNQTQRNKRQKIIETI